MPLTALPALPQASASRALIAQMADDLIRFDAVGNENDAIRSLLWCGRYRPVDVAMLLEAARNLAHQHVVAAQMGDRQTRAARS